MKKSITVTSMIELLEVHVSKKWTDKEKIIDKEKIYLKKGGKVFAIIDTKKEKYAIKVYDDMQLGTFTLICDYYEDCGYKREYGEEIWQNL